MPPLDLSATVTLFFPLFWAYNDEVLCSVQPIQLKILYLHVKTGHSRIGILLRNN